jgi:hypothetical protein
MKNDREKGNKQVTLMNYEIKISATDSVEVFRKYQFEFL